MFEGKSPQNYEQKCLCVIVADISSSMEGKPIQELNKGLRDFQSEVLKDYTASQRLEVAIIGFNDIVSLYQLPTLMADIKMPTLVTGGSTKMADAVEKGIFLVEKGRNGTKRQAKIIIDHLSFYSQMENQTQIKI